MAISAINSVAKPVVATMEKVAPQPKMIKGLANDTFQKNTAVTTNPDEAIKRMKEFNAERLQFEKDNYIDTIDKDNISKITSYTEKLLEDVLGKWEGPRCATDTIGQMRDTVANAIRESLEANQSVIHDMYKL